MDNDIEIKSKSLANTDNQRHKEVLLFLDEELKNIQDNEAVQSYNLTEEYSKTKKNKNWFSVFMLIGCSVVILASAFIMNNIIEKNNEKITVNLSEFDDLNLKGLLDNVAKAQEKYDQAFSTKLSLEAALESGLKDANSQMENDIFLLDSLKIKDQKDYNKRRGEIVKNNTLAQKKLHDEYDERIIVAEKELQIYKEELEKFDTQKIQAAKEQEKAVNSERQLRELEQKELREEYEAQIATLKKQIEAMRSKNASDMHSYMNEIIEKYEAELAALDPVLRDKKANTIITATKEDIVEADAAVTENEDTDETELEGDAEAPVEENAESLAENFLKQRRKAGFNLEQFIQENGIDNQKMIDALHEYQNFYDDYKYLDSAILDLPHKNSIPEYVSASRVLVNEMGVALADSAAELFRENKNLEEKITGLKDDLSKQQTLLENEKKARKTDAQNFENKLQKTQDYYETTLEGIMITAKSNAVILSAESADNIKVFVASKVRDSVTAEGVSGEIKAGKVTVKGTILPVDGNGFLFVPAPDKDGNPVEFDLSLVLPGTAIKTSLK